MKGDYPRFRKGYSHDQLIEHFTLTNDELRFVSTFRSDVNRQAVALLLKSLLYLGYFPEDPTDTPEEVKAYIGHQFGILLDLTRQYLNDSRTRRFHLAAIREQTGFRFATAQDKEDLNQWLLKEATSNCFTEEDLLEAAYQKLRSLQIELPAEKELQRIANSAHTAYFDSNIKRIADSISASSRLVMERLLEVPENENSEFDKLKEDPGKPGLKVLAETISQLHRLRSVYFRSFPNDLPLKFIEILWRRAHNEEATRMRAHPEEVRYGLMGAFIHLRSLQVTDDVVKIFIDLIHRIDVRSENQLDRDLLKEIKKVRGKLRILGNVSKAALSYPDTLVKDAIYPCASKDILERIVKELEYFGPKHRKLHRIIMKHKYTHHYRRMIPLVLENIAFKSSNRFQPIIEALAVIKKTFDHKSTYFHDPVPLEGVVTPKWASLVFEEVEGQQLVNRKYYELCVLQKLERALKCKEIWVEESLQYRDPAKDLPADWNKEDARIKYYDSVRQPLSAKEFIEPLKKQMTDALLMLNTYLEKSEKVKITFPSSQQQNKRGYFSIEKIVAKPEPRNLELIRQSIMDKYGMIDLLDCFVDVDRTVDFTRFFSHSGTKEVRSREELRPMIILDLFAEGTNIGIKRVAKSNPIYDYKQLLYVRKNYFSPEALRNAITAVVNAILCLRSPEIWGEGDTCASDGKHFGAWSQNLTTEWRARYKGYGVLVYWHVEKNAICIYSQLKNFSSSEVAAMIEGLVRHASEAQIKKNFVDSHGQSEVAFAFCKLINKFRLMPRLKGIKRERLYLPTIGIADVLPNLKGVLRRAIRWDLIEQQYDEMIKLAAAILNGKASADAILRRFNSYNKIHPTYKALAELGRVEKTIFLCEYLSSSEMRQQIHEGLNVVENWNATTEFIHYAREGEFSTNSRENQHIAALSLHLLQNCMIFLNTLLIERVLKEGNLNAKLTKDDLRALSPLIHTHINPFGHFVLSLDKPPILEVAA